MHNNLARPAVLIAGGIGITPFMSMLRQATHEQRAQGIILIYANRRPEDAPYLDELQLIAQQNKKFRLAAVMSDIEKSSRHWDGEVGLVTEDLINRVVGDVGAPIYYLVGPPGMIEAMRQTLNRIDVNDDDIRTEEFYGY